MFVDDIIKWFTKKYSGIDSLMEENWLSFKFVDQVSSYIESPKWLRYKNATINPKISMIDVFSMLLCPHRLKRNKKLSWACAKY